MMNKLVEIFIYFCLAVKIIYGQFDCHCPPAHPLKIDEMNQTYCGKELRGADCSAEGVYHCKIGQNVATPQQPFTERENCTTEKIYCAPPLKSECDEGDGRDHCLALVRFCVDSLEKADERMKDYYGQAGLEELNKYIKESDPVAPENAAAQGPVDN